MHFLKKLLSLLLAIAMVVGMAPTTAFAADAEVILDDTQAEVLIAETEAFISRQDKTKEPPVL